VATVAAFAACGGTPLKVGHSGTAGQSGSAGQGGAGHDGGGSALDCGSNGIQTLYLPACDGGLVPYVRCNSTALPPAGTCPAPSCDTLDETACKARPDCQAQECTPCGRLIFSCFPANETPPACPNLACPNPCAAFTEATCNSQPGCAAMQCPDCKGGNVYVDCIPSTEQTGCVPCPCNTLDETTCKGRIDCNPGYCGDCNGEQVFTQCLGPNEAAACPASACPGVVPPPCPGVGTQAACDARIDCHSVFDKCITCDCGPLGCAVLFGRCADGGKASCKGTPVCQTEPPDCDSTTEATYVVSYTTDCYEGCVLPTECGP
jgi:hypothetical protein